MKRQRVKEIDIATGIAIILVVAGHLGWKETMWYFDFKTTLYKFHMPFFMFLSGFLLAYTRYHYSNFQEFKSFIASKSLRFFIPYIFFSILFIVVNIGLGSIRTSQEIVEAIKAVLFYPKSGASGFLWYVYVLIEFYIFFPLLYQIKILRKNIWLFLIVGILINLFLPNFKYLEIRNFATYSLFFAIGFVFQNYYQIVKRFLNSFGLIFLFLFLIIFTLDITQVYQFGITILGLCSIPALLYLSILLSESNYLQYLGKNCFTIYLWNSIFIFTVKFIFARLGFESYFTILVPLYLLAGLSGPLFIKFLLSNKEKNYFIKAVIP